MKEEGPDAANTQNGNGLADRINFDKNLVNVCVNVNDNEQSKITPPGETPPPVEETATLTVNKEVFGCEVMVHSGLWFVTYEILHQSVTWIMVCMCQSATEPYH